MKSELNEDTKLNNNKENTDLIEKIQAKGMKSNSFKTKTLVASFIALIFIIYLIQVLKYNKTIKNYSSLNEKKQYQTEEILKDLKPNPLYKGPIFPDDGKITKEWVFELIDFMKDPENKKTSEEKYIEKVYLLKMISKAKNILQEYESIVDVNIPREQNFTIVGDIHGQFYDLLNIFNINGYPSEENPYLFNGDFVDRGFFGVETIITLIAFKILYPNHFFLNRGNHEDGHINFLYGFRIEAINKYDLDVFNCFSEFYKFLPLGHVLNKKIIVIHGGLFSEEGVTIDELKKIDRFIDIPSEGLMNEILWSDPKNESGWRPSDRGAGIYFGQDVTEKFLKDNNLELLVRSHEVKMEGYEIQHGGKTITIFSAPNYCDTRGNKGAIIKVLGGEMKPNFIQYDASPHPDPHSKV